MSYALFDIGGTNTRVSVSEDLKTFAEPIKFKTPKDFDEGVRLIIEAVQKLTDKDVRGMAGGMRGVLNDEKTEVAHDPGDKLSQWVEKPLAKTLKKKLSTEVFLENDSALVGLGEAMHGAGVGYDIVAYHTVSTGVGGVRIDHGEIDSYATGFEPGHQILDIDRSILGEDVYPTLENLVSGSALEKRSGQKPYDIPQDDAVWDQLAEYLAFGLRNTILYWSPHAIVLGGSMIVGDPRIFLDDIVKHTNQVLGGDYECPDILDAKLGDFGGLYGAMALLNAER
ncbi:MAG: putative NBD/HSP70 family sugar kinase [Candidatus Azotimanducaceae bacterium]|jgi:predicted NBD/HSP70 family sugar kinase